VALTPALSLWEREMAAQNTLSQREREARTAEKALAPAGRGRQQPRIVSERHDHGDAPAS